MTLTKLLPSLFLFLALAGSSVAQKPLPYTTGFDSASEKSGWQLFVLGVFGGAKPAWRYSSGGFSAPTFLTHGAPLGETLPTDNWYVSPQFDFKDGATIDSIRRNFSGTGLPGAGDTIALYLLTGDPDPALATGKVLLHDYRGAAYTNDSIWNKTSPVDIPATSGKSYIALRYRSVNNWLTVAFDNLSVSRKIPAGNRPAVAAPASVQYYPNPTHDVVYIVSPSAVQELRLYDYGGRLLARQEKASQLDLRHLPVAAYILQTVLDDGTVAYTRIVKE